MSDRPPLLAPDMSPYLDGLVPERPERLRLMEAEAARDGFPIIGPAAGQFCRLMARLLGARQIFELGSGFGYSTAWFARAVRENGGGRVHHVVWDEALSGRAREHLGALGLADLVEFHVSEAVAALEAAPGPYDLVFMDIDKHGYPGALPAIGRAIRPGGLLLVDNVLWSGRIWDGTDRSAATEGIREFTRLVAADPAWDFTIVPIRDGILTARRIG